MFQGQCVFSGFMVPKGKGINIVGNDGKLIYLRSNKERSLVEEKISPRNCRWTQSSRAFYKKTNKSVKDNEQFVYKLPRLLEDSLLFQKKTKVINKRR